ncbi:Zinc finger C-x8-C-x5-C-x3-H type (and similar), putative [Angomonas deanei]|uniref:Zinc finger C-x8-C-x5-C-x3-H type (And similar), putative n=1 Tax=Angomonas deanei TaxID=59799 RepID=A0A7G2CD43_9TRYP|nr:Zinc finger C-x8-C-x5-C-x3-H type (and similar), putative [Angomonas deanei]
MTSPRRFTHDPYAPLELSPIRAETAATPPAPPRWFTHHPYALSKISVAEDAPINVIVWYSKRGTRPPAPSPGHQEAADDTQGLLAVDDAVLPPAPNAAVDPEASRHFQQPRYREYSFRTKPCTHYHQTGTCPLGDRCYYYHTRKGREPKRTFDMNCRDNLCTSDDVEQWLDRRAR